MYIWCMSCISVAKVSACLASLYAYSATEQVLISTANENVKKKKRKLFYKVVSHMLCCFQ